MATKKTEKKSEDEKANAFDIEEISELLKLLKENEVVDFKLERSGEKISLKREGERSIALAQLALANSAPAPVAVPSLMPQAAVSAPPVAPEVAAAVASPAAASPAPEAAPEAKNNFLEIKSPMVGTFYTRPTPDAESYIAVGDTVKKGQVVCIIEAMKIMNEIEAEHSGRVVEVCVEDGQMAEYEETLFRIEP